MQIHTEISRRWPNLEWNTNMARMAEAASEHRLLGITGGCSTSKTTFLTAYALAFFDQAPGDTKVVFLCNTLQEAKIRSFGVAGDRYREFPVGGEIVDDRCCILPPETHIKGAGVHWIPCWTGLLEERKKMLNSKCTNLLVIADDAATLPPTIVEYLLTLNFQRNNFQAILAGNPDSIFDSFGLWCQPRHRWSTVSVEDQAWDTRIGHCVHLDGLSSLSEEKVKLLKDTFGEDSAHYQRMVRGFWPTSKS